MHVDSASFDIVAALPAAAGLPFAASLVFAGMPHGAADGAVLAWLVSGKDRPRRRWLLGALLYAAAIVATLLALIAVPGWGLAAFLGVTVLHFALAARRLYRWESLMSAAVNATLLIGLPFLISPQQTHGVLDAAVRLVDREASFPAAASQGAAAAGLMAAAVVPAVLVARVQRGDRRAAAWVLGTAALFTAVHATLPPLMGVGVLFLAWHAVPECVRVGRQIEPGASVARAVAISHAASLPFLVPTLCVVAVWLGVRPEVWSATGVRGVALATLVAYAVLTPVHLVFQEAAATLGVWANGVEPGVAAAPPGRAGPLPHREPARRPGVAR